MYKLTPPGQAEVKLFFRLDGEAAERHGAVCGMQIDFQRGGDGVLTPRFDCQRHLKTPAFKADFKDVTGYLRGGAQPFWSLHSFTAFCREHEGRALTDGVINVPSAFGVAARTEGFSYFLRCHPSINRVNIFAYDNRYLLPELAGKHTLPEICHSVLPSSGALILIVRGQNGYCECGNSHKNRGANRIHADAANKVNGVTRAQEEAMLAGSLSGWNAPAAKPWRYEQDGTPRKPPIKDEPER